MKQLLDPLYEERAIKRDAERAAKMGEPAEKACSYARGTWQYQLWVNVFASEKLREKVEAKRNG